MNNQQDNQKVIEEIERISKIYWEKMNELRLEQNQVIQEYILALEKKKREEVMKKLT